MGLSIIEQVTCCAQGDALDNYLVCEGGQPQERPVAAMTEREDARQISNLEFLQLERIISAVSGEVQHRETGQRVVIARLGGFLWLRT